jgi:ATP-dependent DNA ligase
MEFAKLSQYFEKLEQTSSRLSLIAILSELFSSIKSPDEIEKVCYLVQGRIAPFFEALEIGMAEKTVARSIVIAYNTTPQQVLSLYASLGDMGLAAEQLSKEVLHEYNELSIEEVVHVLATIAQASGKGTIEKRTSLLADLLKQVDSLSAKYLVRIPLGNLRLGIGDATVLDALATVKFGAKQNRKFLESAYNKTSDLGLIAKTLWQYPSQEDALRAVEKLDVQVGKPIRSELCERLPSPEKAIEKMGEVDVQYKYDGFRTQIHKDGTSLINKPLIERQNILKETIKPDDILLPASNYIVRDAKTLSLLLEEAISKGLEGVVLKKLESPYEAGARSFNWVKLKRHSRGELHDTIDCVLLGYIFGRGKRAAFGVGALLVGVYDKKQDMFVTVTKIGTGLSDKEWQSIRERTKGLVVDHKPARVSSLIIPSVWIGPEIVIEVLADEITRSPIHTAGKVGNEPGYALRFPRLVSFRDKDKKPEDATTVDELLEMYQSQGKK